MKLAIFGANGLTDRLLSPPHDWSNVRDRWQLAHAARTTASPLAFVLLTAPGCPCACPHRVVATPGGSPISRQGRQSCAHS
jgi:hypothetical protein